MRNKADKYNVVLITIDSLRADFVGYQNPKENNTPFLDEIAKESFVYINAITPGFPTSFCFPALLTGKLPFTYGYKLGIDASRNNKTIAEVLRENGYQTIAVLADTPQLYSLYNFDRGFDLYLDGHERKSEKFMFFVNTLWNIRQMIPAQIVNLLEYVRAFYKTFAASSAPHIAGKELNKIVKKVLEKKTTQPFFAWIHYLDTHIPYISGIDKYFYAHEGAFDKVFKKIAYYKELAISARTMKINNTELIEVFKEAYRSSIKYVDAKLKELCLFIKDRYPNTIIVVASDHGEGFMEHGLFHHEPYSLYNELINVPLLIYFPSKKRKIIKKVVSILSLAKTICSILNIENNTFGGTDLIVDKGDSPVDHISRVLYKCRSPSIRFQIFDNETEIKGFNELVSYTTAHYKYIMEKGGTIEELYNLEKDPQESENIINIVSKKIVNEFREKLKNI